MDKSTNFSGKPIVSQVLDFIPKDLVYLTLMNIYLNIVIFKLKKHKFSNKNTNVEKYK